MAADAVVAIQVNPQDNVATIFADVEQGSLVTIASPTKEQMELLALSDIPYGHKIASRHIQQGDVITKYGEAIGIASVDIKAGEHVHVHNLESARGRGDWAKVGVQK